MDLASKIIKDLFVIIIVLIGVIIINNLAWIWYINQYDFEVGFIEQDTNYNDNSTVTQTGVDK